MIAAAAPVHSSGFGAAVSTGYPVRLIPAPATLPVAEVVRRLNDAQPPALLAHTSKLVTLAAERRAGRLRIEPRAITAMGETVAAEDRAAIEAAFGIPLITQFTSTEGLVGQATLAAMWSPSPATCHRRARRREQPPIPEGSRRPRRSSPLHSHPEPLIRYELTDRSTPPPVRPPFRLRTRDRRRTRRRRIPLRGHRYRPARDPNCDGPKPRPHSSTRCARPRVGSTSRSSPKAN